MKYNENEIIKEISEYVKSTYGEHYVSNATGEKGFQVQDLLRSVGIDKDFCQANAIKYLARYDKKNGRNRKDLLKAIHYVILLMSSEDATAPTVSWAEDKDDRKEITIENAKTRLEQMSVITHDPITD